MAIERMSYAIFASLIRRTLQHYRTIALTLPSLISAADGMSPSLSSSEALETIGSLCMLANWYYRSGCFLLPPHECNNVPCDCYHAPILQVVRNELSGHDSVTQPLASPTRGTYLQLLGVPIDVDVVKASTHSTVPQLLALYSMSMSASS